jgi:hypothetical protein
MADPKSPNNKAVKPGFDLDAEKTGLTEMPSITKLLARKPMNVMAPKVKSINVTQTAGKALPADPAPPVNASPAVAAHPKTSPAAVAPAAPKSSAPVPAAPKAAPAAPVSKPPVAPVAAAAIPNPLAPPPSERTGMIVMPTRRSTRGQTQDLQIWDRAALQTSPDAVCQALTQLLGRGLGMALFLAHHSAGGANAIPIFKAQACYGSGSKQVLWKGLSWNPALTPTLWQQLSITGAVELTPPDTGTNVTSERNMVRTAFGIDSNEYLVVARVGAPSAIKGILAMVSARSFLTEVQGVLMLLAAGSGKTGAIKKAS